MMVAAGRALLPCWPGIPAAVFILFHVTVITVVSAIPVENFPINSQLPPVARISEPFSFTFSPSTFSSDLDMSYSLGNDTPAWLSIDSDARRLFGTPGDADLESSPADEDVIGMHVELVARDATGLATTNATLVISRNPAPSVEIPLSEQIAGFGPYSTPSSLLLYPSRPFSFSFAEGTFTFTPSTVSLEGGDGDADAEKEKDGPTLNYYGVSGDSAPLPSWVSLDADTLTFSGTTPPFESLVQPPQTFGFQLIASDVVGFASAASIPFSIVVGNHELTADEVVVRLNASHGKPFEFTDLKGETLKIDGRPLAPGGIDDITSVEAVDLPPWLKFDDETWGLSGTPDATAESSNVTIAVVDRYTDSLNVTVMIEMHMELFVSDLPDMNLTAGGDLSFDLKRYLFDPKNVDISIESQPSSPWIIQDSTSKKLFGTAPEPRDAAYAADITVTLTATSKRNQTTDTRTVVLHVADPSSTDSTPVPTTTPAGPAEVEDSKSRRNLLWLLLPFLLLLCIAVILLIIYLRRRQRRLNKDHIMEVSAPIPGTFVNHGLGSSGSSMQDMRKMLDVGPPGTRDIRVVGSGPGAAHGMAVTASSNPHASRVVSDPRAGASLQPHALSLYNDRRRSRSDTVLIEMRRSWLPRIPGLTGYGGGVVDGRSFLSDTSLSEGDVHTAEEAGLPGLAATTSDESYEHNRLMLDVPINSEPLSIQPTPELAYKPAEGATSAATAVPAQARRFDLSSSSGSSETASGSSSLSSQPTPIVGYARARDSQHHPHYHHQNYHFYHRPRSGRLSLGIGSRLSRALKRASGQGQGQGQQNRSSNLSSSTAQTTRTSILTTALAEQQRQAQVTFTATAAGTVASSIVGAAVARPTIVHIPSRPGEVPNVLSRRRAGGSDSTPLFFGGGSGDRSRRNPNPNLIPNQNREGSKKSPQDSSSQNERTPPDSHPLHSQSASASYDSSDSSWDRHARDSLGIAHKDLVTQLPLPRAAAKAKNSSAYRHNMGLDLGLGLDSRRRGSANSMDDDDDDDDVGARLSWTVRPLRISPVATTGGTRRLQTPEAVEDEGRDATATAAAAAPSTAFQTLVKSTSRHRRQAPISQTTPSPPPLLPPPSPPSNDNRTAAAMATRPLPETPTPAGRGGRKPLADRLNESTPRRRSSSSPRNAESSSSSAARMKKRIHHQGNGDDDDDDDDDDTWEDIQPPDSSTFGRGGGGDGESDGSFAVYI